MTYRGYTVHSTVCDFHILFFLTLNKRLLLESTVWTRGFITELEGVHGDLVPDLLDW